MDYCMSAFRKSRKEEAIYNYLADGLFALVNQTVHYEMRLCDLLHPVSEEEKKKQKKDDKEEAKRIQDKLKKKLRG